MKYVWKGLKNNTFAEGEIEAESKDEVESEAGDSIH